MTGQTTTYRPGSLPTGYDWAVRWQPDPVGQCVRPGCITHRAPDRLTHTLGPDGCPWHAYCWSEPEEPR
jgi:hypothetical protein